MDVLRCIIVTLCGAGDHTHQRQAARLRLTAVRRSTAAPGGVHGPQDGLALSAQWRRLQHHAERLAANRGRHPCPR